MLCRQVYMAKEIATGEIVALKKVRMDNEKEGFPITAIREIKILKKLQHENVIRLKEIVTSSGPEGDEQGRAEGNKYKGSIYMVFEYMDHDLTGLSDRPGMRFTIPQVKCYVRQLLTGLHYCHINQVLHRDIKGSNLLIDNNGILKLADFGLARFFTGDQNAKLTNRVITLWYRPPELLLGSTKYGPAVDMWSVGCIFAELLCGKPILPGKNEVEQLNKIFELCGSPEESTWPGVSKLPWFVQFKPARSMKRRVREVFKNFDRHALDLLERLLTLDPAQRITAQDALDAEYFWNDPAPCDPSSLPKYESSHEYQTKKKRQQQRQQQEELSKRQKIQHPQAHSRLPPMQQAQVTAVRTGPNQPVHNTVPSAGVHHYGGQRAPMGPQGRYPQPGGRPPHGGPNIHYNQSRGSQGTGFNTAHAGGYGPSSNQAVRGAGYAGANPPYGHTNTYPNTGGSSHLTGGSRGPGNPGHGRSQQYG
ncbi:hypothetical protein KP509_07G031100 [Ceratopteris richardii]|uniref:Protein kinase domain-containing protein n=1 Tax=Ceratopteris richardii TaxID=49495 RepID=A0A8T2U8P4_CERRI|nr:hypothetical protein KP509_07G031100 [Ceratopteris richardii]